MYLLTGSVKHEISASMYIIRCNKMALGRQCPGNRCTLWLKQKQPACGDSVFENHHQGSLRWPVPAGHCNSQLHAQGRCISTSPFWQYLALATCIVNNNTCTLSTVIHSTVNNCISSCASICCIGWYTTHYRWEYIASCNHKCACIALL